MNPTDRALKVAFPTLLAMMLSAHLNAGHCAEQSGKPDNLVRAHALLVCDTL